MAEFWPLEIRISEDKKTLRVLYEDGSQSRVSADRLRVESPSAEVQGHGPGQKIIVTGKENVRIINAEPVGNYAVRLHFDDGHKTGLFTWSYLQELDES
jgi:DUF971 family protein